MNESKAPAPAALSRPTNRGRGPSAGCTGRATARYQCSPAPTQAMRGASPSAERRPRRRPFETIVDGRYRLLDRVGSGGTAAVYLAEDLVLGRNVALKLLHDCFAEDEEFVERFRLEASRAAGLHHRQIVSVFDRGEWDGTHYMTMEYVPGRSLRSLIRDAAPLAPAHAIELVVQLLRAARYIHGRGIMHRDLKPDNAIVGSDGQLKLTDFGISRAGASQITQTGTVLGTAQYVSPEQAEGHAVSAATDLYSIGVILYELLTGRVPFEGETVVAILLAHVKERPMAPSAHNGAVPRKLDAIVMRALEKPPAARFADADAFIEALEHAKAALRLEDISAAATRPDHLRLAKRAAPLRETKRMGLLHRARLPSIPSIRRRSLNPDPVGARPC